MSGLPKSKRGSSRRKGDEFQDLCALRLALELYSMGIDFRIFLEYENIEAVDDIVIFTSGNIRGVQAKYAVDSLAVYVPDDFTNEMSRTYIGRYMVGWQKARATHPDCDVTVELLSNRGRDSTLEGIIGPDGRFAPAFIEGRKLGAAKEFRNKLKTACGLAKVDGEEQFKEFLNAFRFQLGQRSLHDLRNHIEGEVLDHRLGISDRAVFHELKELIEIHAIELHEPIIPAHLDEIFRRAQRRFLLPQVFPVDAEHFVEVPTFRDSLMTLITGTDAGYIVVTGLPGSGKSTSLSEFFDGLQGDQRFAVCRYFCFLSPEDSAGRLRLEAEALRVDLLSDLHRQFGNLLNHQHDYSEHRFIEVLSELGSVLSAEGRKLVILVDGLDHAERDDMVRESILRALPAALPPGVIVVAGTQELKNWQPLALREGHAQRHTPIPLFTLEETRAYLTGKHKIMLDDSWIARIHAKSQGLPLYLRYVALWLGEHGGDPATLDAMPEAVDGDIRNYYERLWANFERNGMSHARHLCGVMAELRFPVQPDELSEFQTAITAVDVSAAIQAIAHLLRTDDGQISLFHDSFRVFIKSKIDMPTRQRITRDILAKLKSERGSGRWFSHTFRYALEAGDEDYLLTQVNRLFVDFALQHCRPAQDIFAAIDAAVKAAVHRKDLVTLARLGSLHYRTYERLEQQFDYGMLAKVQLALGRIGDVLDFCLRPGDRQWLVNDNVAMQILEWCAKSGQRGLGDRLFAIFRETHANKDWSDRHEIERLAHVVAIYSKSPVHFLRWLSRITFSPDTLERPDPFAPGFAPHLWAFLSTFFLYALPDAWNRLKRMKRLFPNQLVRHFSLRLVAQHHSSEQLAAELDDYLAHTSTVHNLEIAGFAALAGLPATRVRELAGPVVLPPRETHAGTRMSSLESDLDTFKWSALVLGSDDDPASIDRVAAHIGGAKTMYSGFLRFLFQFGLCLGRPAASKSSDAYAGAVAALHELSGAGTEDEPSEMDTLRASRPMLPDMLFRLSHHVARNCPEQLDTWCNELLALRKSEMWTSHWGITEITEDYTFELRIWERLIGVPGIRSRLLPILQSCAKTYMEATALKAGSRCDHLLELAAIAGQCGWRTEAEKWREIGIASSLTYGYHKDVTLDYLIDVLELLNEHEPQYCFPRAAAILDMARWMWAATDNRETKHFEKSVFRVVLQTSREAAFALIRHFRENTGRWKMLDCLEQFCSTAQNGDPEIFWTLKDVFTPHFVEKGRHSKQVIRTVHSLRELGKRQNPTNVNTWDERYTTFIRTRLDHAWWPDDIWHKVTATESRTPRHATDPYNSPSLESRQEITFGGQPIPPSEVKRLLEESIDSFCHTVEQLRSENSHFYNWGLIGSALQTHATKQPSVENAQRLWKLARDAKDLVGPEALRATSNMLFDVGEFDAGFDALLLAYQHSSSSFPGSNKNQPYLVELCLRDKERLASFLAEQSEENLHSDYGGFDLPRMIARYYSTTGDVDRLRNVFQDYLTHCEELFAHFPKDERYQWLRDFKEGGRDESEEIVEFLVDLIGEPEIDQSERLIRVVVDLAKTRPALVCRVVSRRMQNVDPLLRERLEVLLNALAWLCPSELSHHLETLVPILKEPHFRLRTTLVRIIHRIGETVPISAEIAFAAEEAERAYSPLIAYPTRRFLHTKPSPEFVGFLKHGLLTDLRDRIKYIGDLVRIHPGAILYHIEQSMRKSGWNEAEENERLKSEWEGNVDEKCVVWFVPSFHTRFSELLQIFLHQVVENGRYEEETLSTLKNIVLGGDPEFVATLPEAKPIDIPPLDVTDAAVWNEEIRTHVNLIVETLPVDGWTTIFEERLLSQTTGSHPIFSSTLRVRSLLVTPAFTNRSQEWPPEYSWSDQIHCRYIDENLSLQDARLGLLAAKEIPYDLSGNVLPLVSIHKNGALFHGCNTIAFLHPIWLARFDLEIKGHQITLNDQCIAHLEEWQEGYEDNPYTRDMLSAGTRLVVRNDWLRTLLLVWNRSLIIQRSENRIRRDGLWRSEPIAKSKGIRLTAYVSVA